MLYSCDKTIEHAAIKSIAKSLGHDLGYELSLWLVHCHTNHE